MEAGISINGMQAAYDSAPTDPTMVFSVERVGEAAGKESANEKMTNPAPVELHINIRDA